MAGTPLGLILSSNTGRPAPGPVVQIPVYAVWRYKPLGCYAQILQKIRHSGLGAKLKSLGPIKTRQSAVTLGGFPWGTAPDVLGQPQCVLGRY